MSGSVTVETLPVNVLTRQVLENQHENAIQRLGKGDSQGRYDITRTLTIWLRLQGKSEGGGGGGGRGHKLKGGQSRSRIAGSHEIVNRGGAQSTGVTGRTDRRREGNYPEKRVEEKKKKKERRRTKKGREKGAACQCCPVHG
jgi:hypothetical protein